ncbi:MAG TPA: molybdopterin cofactor-binding domain-containing protein [Gaiellaceae bacterium]|jgi:CO/xanthine dehydrogenase Mo-binding subunit
MHEKQGSEHHFSRKSLLKGGGALIVGFSMAGALLEGKAAAATPTAGGYLPDATKVDSWLVINPDNTVTLLTTQPEVGQGTWTGFSMILAEELDMDLSQMRVARADTWLSVSSGGVGGSGSISGGGARVRAAGVAARSTMLGLASTQLGVPAGSLTVSKGVVSGGGKTVTYGTLVGGKLLGATLGPNLNAGQAPAKAVGSYSLVGTAAGRLDIPAKVNGTYTYVHNIRVPGMLHARVVRPRGQGGVTSVNNRPVSVDESSISHIANAKVVRVGDFIAVVAPKEYDAIEAAGQLKVVWKSDPLLPGSGNFWSNVRSGGDSAKGSARYTTNVGDVTSSLASAAKTVSASYTYQYNGHMPIGPTCAVADVKANSAVIYCNSQDPEGVPTTLAGFQLNGQPYFGLQASQVRAIFYEGSSSYGSHYTGGHGYDCFIAAAVISKAVGAPVRLQWMRWDEHGWGAYGPAAMYDVKAGIDASGNMVGLDWTSYGQAGTSLMTTSELTGFGTWPAVAPLGGPGTSDTIYKVSTTGKRVLAKSQPQYNGAFKSFALRAPGAQQSHFAGEQIVDELAHAAGMDPLAFRRLNIDASTIVGQRWNGVLDTAAKISSWQPKVAASQVQTGNVVTGRGFGFGTFANTQVGIVADISVNKKTGKITTNHLYIAQANGFSTNPDLVANQAMGSAIMGLSRALYEELTFTKERITSVDWVSYPILRFKDSPKVTVALVDPTGHTVVTPGLGNTSLLAANTAITNAAWPTSGAGEPASVPPGSAIANAFFDATGVRIRQAPMTAARVRVALKTAGVA